MKMYNNQNFQGQKYIVCEEENNLEIEIYQWLVDTFGGKEKGCYSYVLPQEKIWSIYKCSYGSTRVSFWKEEHVNWFTLRWS